MSTEDMIKYLEKPQELNEYSLSELRALLRKYPYFHTAHVLFLLNLKNINDPRYREFLKQSAVYIKDRDKFLRLVNQLGDERDITPSGQQAGKGQASGEPETHSKEKDSNQTSQQGNAPGQQANEQVEDAGRKKSVGKDNSQAPPKEEQRGKAAEGRKEKDFSTEYLRNRIAETLSEQKGDSGDQDKESSEWDSDFFIIDKVTQVEEKMTRRLREKYQQENRKKQDSGKQDEGEADFFELDNSTQAQQARPDADTPEEEKSTPDKEVIHFGGEYFSEKEYRRNQETARKEQNDLIEKFIRKAPELESITPSEKDNQDISSESVEEKEDLASEKLIEIYIQQGYYKKAIQAYEKLSLKYPEKSDYFAEQIKKLKTYIDKQKK